MSLDEFYKLYLENPEVCTDTRKITPNCIFFALKGDNFNGNKFAQEAINKGASFAVIDEESYATSTQLILVDDVLTFLQQLANYHRKQLNIPFIGITGSNGKTTTKELLYAVLSKKYRVTATAGNFNNHIGVPLTLLAIPTDCEMAIIEMGANHVGEIDFLCHIAEPNFGIITNIGKAHLEGFGGFEGVKKAKSELYRFIAKKEGLLFVNSTNDLLMDLAKNCTKTTFGSESSDVSTKLLNASPTLSLEWQKQDQVYPIHSNLYGEYNYENIAAAVCIGDYFNVEVKAIVAAIENYVSANNRSQLIQHEGYTIFLDAYNANPTSMSSAIDTFHKDNSTDKLMILGDMLEMGNVSKEEHQRTVDHVLSTGIPAIFVGEEFNGIANKHDFVYVSNYEEVIQWMAKNDLKNATILIKGSRGIRLEKVAEYLCEPDHN